MVIIADFSKAGKFKKQALELLIQWAAICRARGVKIEIEGEVKKLKKSKDTTSSTLNKKVKYV